MQTLNVNIHNKFEFELRDATTGELRQSATAYNIVLNDMFNRLCNGYTFFTHIQLGTGTGTLSPTRTTLFSYLIGKAAVKDTVQSTYPVGLVRKYIRLEPEEAVGASISEVAIAYAGTGSIVTHALLKDAEGNPIVIQKTGTDVLLIYATVYVDFTVPIGTHLIGGTNAIGAESATNNNYLYKYLLDGSSSMITPSYVCVQAGVIGQNSDPIRSHEGTTYDNLGAVSSVTCTADVANKKMTLSTKRFSVSNGNGPIRSVTYERLVSFDFPTTNNTNTSYADVPVATGDGTTASFKLPSFNTSNISVKVAGVAAPHTVKRTQAFVLGSSLDSNFNDLHKYSLFDMQPDGLCGYGVYSYRETVRMSKIYRYSPSSTIQAVINAEPCNYSGANWVSGIPFIGTDKVLYIDDKYIRYYYIDKNNKTTYNDLRPAPGTETVSVNAYSYLSVNDGFICLRYSSSNTSQMGKYYNVDTTNDTYTYKQNILDGLWPTETKNAPYVWAASPDGTKVAFMWYTQSSTAPSTADRQLVVLQRVGDLWAKMPNPADLIRLQSTDLTVKFITDDLFYIYGVSYDAANVTYRKLFKIENGTLYPFSGPDHLIDSTMIVSKDGTTCYKSGSSTKNVGQMPGPPLVATIDKQAMTITEQERVLCYAPSQLQSNFYNLLLSPAGIDPANGKLITSFVYNTNYDKYYKKCYSSFDDSWLDTIVLETPPALGEAVTASYTVAGIHKTDQYVLDVGMEIQFGGTQE